jgi:hypothetical protein
MPPPGACSDFILESLIGSKNNISKEGLINTLFLWIGSGKENQSIAFAAMGKNADKTNLLDILIIKNCGQVNKTVAKERN